jgi:hypothetical protein
MTNIQYDIPIAIFIFNRPEETKKLFEVIAAIRPKKLLVVSDGARPSKPNEKSVVEEVRAIVSKVDWPCELRRNYSDINLGCKKRVSSGLDWVFSLVEHAVILEDDCLPSIAFFSYCRVMLTMYQKNPKVFSISGTSFVKNNCPSGHYLSDFALMWGWATWRDRWQHYQVNPKHVYRTVLRQWWHRPLALFYWLLIYFNLTRGKIDTWDYQWILTVWRNHGLVVRPNVNLVMNIGFGENATHTTNSDHALSSLVAWEGDADFTSLCGGFQAQRENDAIDETVWAGIGWKAPIIMIIELIKNR